MKRTRLCHVHAWEIWWDDGSIIVALINAQNSQNVTRGRNRIDSNLAHVKESPRVAQKLGRTIADDFTVRHVVAYCGMPRTNAEQPDGPATDTKRFSLIVQ